MNSNAWPRRLVRWFCMRAGSCRALYIHFGRPDFLEYAEFLLRHHGLRIGENTTINTGAVLTMDAGRVTIGRDCSISAAHFVTHSGYDRIVRKLHGVDVCSTANIVIGDRCAIGIGAILKYGVTIGDDSVVAMGAVVFDDVPPGSVVRGNPARVTGTTADYITRLKHRSLATKVLPALSDAAYRKWRDTSFFGETSTFGP